MTALHYNENAQRPQARNNRGELLHSLRFSKKKNGEVTVQPVCDAATFNYIARLMRELTEQGPN